jgi:hypothetical protein
MFPRVQQPSSYSLSTLLPPLTLQFARSYFAQNRDGGGFSFEQVEALASGLKGRVLMVLPERYAGKLQNVLLASVVPLVYASPRV